MKRIPNSLQRWLGGLALTVGLLAFSRPACADQPAAKLTAEQHQKQLVSFDIVWQTVRDKHWDPKLGGLDWPAVRDELRPRMEKATTLAECWAVLHTMLERLGQSHFEIIPESAYKEIDKAAGDNKNPAGEKKDAAPRDGTAGFDVRVLDGQVLVVKVPAGSPAAKLGVRPGWRVVKVGDQDMAKSLAKLRAIASKSLSLDYQLNAAAAARLRGHVGDKLTIDFDTGEKQITLDVPLSAPAGEPTRFGNLPTFYVTFESRTLPGNIGYFAMSAFLDPPRVMKGLEEAVAANRGAAGFILDLRGNPGGIGAMAIGVGGWFVRERNQVLGTLISRDSSFKFTLNPRAEPFTGPLAVLVDGMSASTTEILAGGLQDLKRAKVFGTRSAGAALPAQMVRLPSGDVFLYAFANYISSGGQALEGRGVRPDTEIPLSRESLLKGDDPVVDAAVKWIQSQKPAAGR